MQKRENTRKGEVRRAAQPVPVAALGQLQAEVRKWLHLPDLGIIEIVLATVAANLMPGDPVWLLLAGPSGSGKTEALNLLPQVPNVHLAATLTEAALLSGTPQKERSPNSTGGLLKAVGDFGILVLKDFTSVLAMNPNARGPTLAAFREIYDGSWTRLLGVDGGLALEWHGKLGLVGGVTSAIDRAHAVMSSMGERFLLYRLPPTDGAEQAKRVLTNTGDELKMRAEFAAMGARFFKGLVFGERRPKLSPNEEEWLIALAGLVALCRSPIERDGRSRDIEYIPAPEAPGRLTRTLSQLLAGLKAIGVGAARQRELIVKVGLDCIPPVRRMAFDFLSKAPKGATTSEIGASRGYPDQTTRRALEELKCHGIVEKVDKHSLADFWRMTDHCKKALAVAKGPFPKR